MKKNRIFLNDWLELKPYQNATITDSYYVKLTNELKSKLDAKDILVLGQYLDNDELDILCCFLTSYLEDLVSETNIWNTFVKTHKNLYNKYLPFYDTTNYIFNEPNLEDIVFLIWYFLNTIQEEKFIDFNNGFIKEVATKLYELINYEFDYAPENKVLKKLYFINENETDYYVIRNLMDIVFLQSYLFFTDLKLNLLEAEVNIIENPEILNEKKQIYLNENRDVFLHNSHSKLLAFSAKEWTANYLGEKHKLYNVILNISKRIEGYFLYKFEDEDSVTLEHIASDKLFKVTKESINPDLIKNHDAIIYMGLVRLKEEWWFSGVQFVMDFNADLILDEKNSAKSKQMVSFLDHKVRKKEFEETQLIQLNIFKKLNNNYPIAFLPSKNIEPFISDNVSLYNKGLKLSKKDIKKAQKRIKTKGYFGGLEDEVVDFSTITDTGLVFFNPKSGIEIAFEINSAFSLPNNPYFNLDESNDDIMHLLISKEFSTELVYYCIENCQSKLHFFKKGKGKIFKKDLDFLLRFWKCENYKSTPLVTYI